MNRTALDGFDSHQEVWREPPSVIRILHACGWLTVANRASHSVRIHEISRSHTVYRVVANDGSAVIIKQLSRSAWESGRSLVRELYVYRLAGWIEELAAILPKALLIDEHRQLLILEALPAAADSITPDKSLRMAAPGIAAQLGTAMATWHHKTAGISLPPALAEGILWLPDALETASRQRPDSTKCFMRALASDVDVVAALRKARSIYRQQCLIHGDIKSDNWLREELGQTDRLKVIDWELSGVGDAAWDVASACAEALLDLIHTGGNLDWGSGGWPIAVESVLREFLFTYQSASGVVNLHDPHECQRVALFTAARLFHVACEWADHQMNIDSGIVKLVTDQGRCLLLRCDDASRSLLKWVAQ